MVEQQWAKKSASGQRRIQHQNKIRRNYTSSTQNKDFHGFMITTNYGGSLKVQASHMH